MKNEKVTLIVPTCKNYEYLDRLIYSILTYTKYPNYEVVIADNSTSPQVRENIKYLIQPFMNINRVVFDYYNFSSINNDVVELLENIPQTKNTDLLIFCNDDIEFTSDVITTFVEYWRENKKVVGTLGARLHFDDGKVQHSGMYVPKDENGMILGLTHYGYGTDIYYPEVTEVFGNTAALMMIEKRLFENLGGFNEEYNECFEDVELNLKCVVAGRKNMFLPDAVALHSESVTRKKDTKKEERERKDFETLSSFIRKNINNKHLNKFLR